MFKIIGIIIVVNTNLGGDQLLFRYPSVSRKEVSQETMRAFAAHSVKRLSRDEKTSKMVKNFLQSENEIKVDDQQRELQEYEAFNLPSVSLAPQLIPEASLCNRSFELIIENTMFLGHPIVLPSFKGNSEGKERNLGSLRNSKENIGIDGASLSPERGRSSIDGSEGRSSLEISDRIWNRQNGDPEKEQTERRDCQSPPKMIEKEEVKSIGKRVIEKEERNHPFKNSNESDGSDVRTLMANDTAEVTSAINVSLKGKEENRENRNYGSNHANVASEQCDHDRKSTIPDRESSPSPFEQRKADIDLQREEIHEEKVALDRDQPRIFNVCLVLAQIQCSSLFGPYGNEHCAYGTLKKFKFVAKQLATAIAHEEYRCGYLSEQANVMMNIREAWLIAQKEERVDFIKPDHQALTSQLLSVAVLARELRDVYHGLRERGMISMQFNNWSSIAASINEDQDCSRLNHWPIRPYQSLLILPTDSSSNWMGSLQHSNSIYNSVSNLSSKGKGRITVNSDDHDVDMIVGSAGDSDKSGMRRRKKNSNSTNSIAIDNDIGEEEDSGGGSNSSIIITSKKGHSNRSVSVLSNNSVATSTVTSSHNNSKHIEFPLPPDSSASLRRLLELAKPTRSFRELQADTDIPLVQLLRLSAHLVYWNRARIIYTITKWNVYVLNHNRPPYEFPSVRLLDEEFQRMFSNFHLDEILAMFSCRKSLGEHLDLLAPSLHKDFIDVVIWLLQRNLIIQLHTFVHLMIPTNAAIPETNSGGEDLQSLRKETSTMKHPRNANALSEESLPSIGIHCSDDNRSNEEEDIQELSKVVAQLEKVVSLYPASPSPLKPYEKSYLQKQLEDKGPSFQLLERLCPYFRGKHTMEEILWRENISREEFSSILNRYSAILVSCVHEATTTS